MEAAEEFLALQEERGVRTNMDKIVISVSGLVFPEAQFEAALHSASELAEGKGTCIEVYLPSRTVHVTKPLSIPSNVSLVGRSDRSGRLDSCSRVALSDAGNLVFANPSSKVSNCIISFTSASMRQTAVTIEKDSDVEFRNCVFENDSPDHSRDGTPELLSFGRLWASSCLFVNCGTVFEEGSTVKISACHFVRHGASGVSSGSLVTSLKAAITINKVSSDVEIAKTLVSGSGVGLLVDSCRKVKLSDVSITSCVVGVDVLNSSVSVIDSKLTNIEERCLNVKGGASEVELRGTSLGNAKVGIAVDNGAFVQVLECGVKNMSICGVRVESDARFEAESLDLTNEGLQLEDVGNTTLSDGVQLIKGGQAEVKKSSIRNYTGRAVVCQDNNSTFSFEELECSNNKLGALLAVDGAKVKGVGLTAVDNDGEVVSFSGEGTKGELSKIKVNGGDIGLCVSKGPVVKFKECKLEALKDKAVYTFNSFVTVNQAQITQTKTKKIGVHVKFKGTKRCKVVLQDCKAHQCSEGIRVEQVFSNKESKESIKPKAESVSEDSTSDSGSNGNELEGSKCVIENAAFVQCVTGFYVNAAKVDLLGCSFIMSQHKSIIMENHKFRQGAQVRKESNISIRWPNYVEPYIDNGDSISNDHQLLTSVTKEKSFCGSADFEPIMYISTLTERIRQGRTLFRSKEPESMPTARVIMRSVSHMLILLKQLTPRLLDRELNDDPDLGMFAATFKLYKDKSGPSNTLISMQELFDSWKGLHRTRLFDQALSALNEAFNEKQVTEEMYDEWVTPLEEMQRVCFVKSKYNRRRDYLLTTAKETPLTTWYFLEKESEKTDEGKKLREEVLQFLAADREEHRSFNKTHFHASWVAQWAIHLLGPKFREQQIPEDAALRKAWAGSLLDVKNPKRVLDQYDSVTLANASEYDELLKFECLVMYESEVTKLNAAQVTKLTSVLGGQGFPAAMKTASKFFLGDGALPGFLRRVAEDAKSIEVLLDPLSNINEISTTFTRKQRDKVVLAVMSHHVLPDSQKPPEGYRRPDNTYETCEMCLVQKLQPWNSVKLDACKHNHRYCKECFKFSMSQGQQQLWGLCPGRADDNTSCGAQATRREMELAGMNNDLIYNILSKRITNLLQDIPSWKPCDAPGCIGGRSNVTKTFYTCRLCNKMITTDNGASDPTVPRRLLQGLDGTTVTRGEGVFRECYFCAVTYEKGNACSTITCSHCNKQFSMTWGPEKITHRFDEEGIPPQRYVPKVEGKLWDLGVFKDRKGKPLKLGQTLTDVEAAEVVRRAKLKLVEYTE